MEKIFDVVIIGGGPGGYVAAIRASQLGMQVALVEKRKTLGGTCLNIGCVPSKALLDSSEFYEMARTKGNEFGIRVSEVTFELQKILARKDKIVQEITGGVDFLIKKNKIERFHGAGKILKNNMVEIQSLGDRIQTIKGKKILIAAGAKPASIPGIDIDGSQVIVSDHALNLSKVPAHLIVIGAGVIGLELGTVWHRLGSRVTFIEMLDGLLGENDKQVSSQARRIFEGQGLKFHFATKVKKIEKTRDEVIVEAEARDGKREKISGDILLVAVGRIPNLDDLGLTDLGLELEANGRIKINPEDFSTSIPDIYAIGDCINGPMLAHRASEEGITWAEKMHNQAAKVNYRAIPSILYTSPEIACIGKGEEELKIQGIAYKVGRAYFRANGRSQAMAETEGMVKILADKKTDELLGIFIIGPRASELIAEAVVFFEYQGTAEDIARSVHAHPTLAEVIKEAAMAVDNRAIHG
jgi:dihydrolipoamide dehydrogenase